MRSRWTEKIRWSGTLLWCLGLVFVALDIGAFSILRERASPSYFFFVASAVLVAWAEKREFGTRGFLYRLHDVLIYSPWKFFFLYFLWISVFSPYTIDPKRSMLYATNGWLSLFTVGITAQFLFCQREMSGVMLLPARLSLAFQLYAVILLVLFANVFFHLFFPAFPLGIRMNEQVNLFLFFTIGFPFLIWDLFKKGRKLLPDWLSGSAVVVGGIVMSLVGRRFYHVALLLSVGSLLSFYLYKKIRLKKAIILSAGILLLVLISVGSVREFLRSNEMWRLAYEQGKELLDERMTAPLSSALEVLWKTGFMGQGLGQSPERGVWARILAEAGVVGFLLYLGFFVELFLNLFTVRRSSRLVVSNVAVISLGIFLALVSHYVENPYGAYVWVWYAIWVLFASTPKKKEKME